MGILKQHQKTDIRFQRDNIIMYHPTEIQLEEINKILSETLVINEGLDAKGEIDSKTIRYIIREMTSIGAEIDEYTDEEFLTLLDNGDRVINLLMREVSTFITELTEDMQYNQYLQIDTMSKMANIINNANDEAKMKEKFDKLFKKNGLNITFDDLTKTDVDPKLLEKQIKKIGKNKKKIK